MKRILAGTRVVITGAGMRFADVPPECCDECGALVGGGTTGGWVIGRSAICDRCVLEMAAESAAHVRVLRGDSAEVRR